MAAAFGQISEKALVLSKLEPDRWNRFKSDMQEAFQKGFEAVYGSADALILPERDIEASMNAEGAIAYQALLDGELVGGAIVAIDETTQHNYLELLYVKYGVQARGVGVAIWTYIEKQHPDTRVWETCTPYFEKRNIHFYVNKCGFHIVRFLNGPDSLSEEDSGFAGDGGEGMFIFEKRM